MLPVLVVSFAVFAGGGHARGAEPPTTVDAETAQAIVDGFVARCEDGSLGTVPVDFVDTCADQGGVDVWLGLHGVCVDGEVVVMSEHTSCVDHRGFASVLLPGLAPAPSYALELDAPCEIMLTLELDSVGPEVACLELRLVQVSTDATPIDVDDVFDLATDAAVREFQFVNDLTVDGVVGPQTVAALGVGPGSVSTTTTAAPVTAAPVTTVAVRPLVATNVYFENCDAARAAGADPVRRGDPGYRPGLDRDGDGVGCE